MEETRIKRQYIVNESGEKTFVVLSVEDYKRLMEDIQDLAAIAERTNEPRISLEELERNLKADGLL
ncbi:MAG: type II toxin-antitoxin system prevent-host-death family antitoxin [Candidatus Marinimicrobia bacterium]|nr:type II toxin-antitoxin system prevent-host-death family antitoxin [Candidatus Neomarinimicrobiota bacterium]